MDLDALKHKADTELKLYSDLSDNQAVERAALEELADLHSYITRSPKARNSMDEMYLMLYLSESIQGNVFNRPYPYMILRGISNNSAKNVGHDRDDGEPNKDYFYTLRSVRREIREESVGFVFMGFKVINNDEVASLDDGWIEWSGLRELIRALDGKNYVIKRVLCLKAVNQKPDVFKYSILIEIARNDGCDIDARDTLQRFRIRRMSGYVALYKRLTETKLQEAFAANDALDEKAFNLCPT